VAKRKAVLGRPARSAADIAQTRAAIAAAAATLFREEGYRAVSMRRLAEAAGCTPMTLYAYFDGKADILRHLWGGFFDELFSSLARIAARTPDARTRLKRLSSAYVRYWLADPERYRIVFMTEGVSQAETGVFAASAETVARYAVFFDAMRAASGATSEADLKLRVDALICGLHGVAHNAVTISAYPWETPARLTDLFVDALVASA